MRKVIMLPESNQEETKKPVELTHCLQAGSGSWYESYYPSSACNKLIHIGSGRVYKFPLHDLFFHKRENGDCVLYMGHLNSGEY